MDNLNLQRAQIEAQVRGELEALLYDRPSFVGQPGNSDAVKFKLDKSLSREFNKMFLSFMASFCHVDLLAVERVPRPQGARIKRLELSAFRRRLSVSLPTSWFSLQGVQSSEWRRKGRKKLWPYALILFWLVCALHVVYYLCHQYAYDYYSFRLSRVRWLRHARESIPESYSRLESEDWLLEQLEERARTLKHIGAPHMHLGFAVECIYMLVLIGGLILHLMLGAYFTWKSPFSFYFVRDTFDHLKEQQENERFVHEQVQKFATMNERPHDFPRHLSLVAAVDCATTTSDMLNEMLAAGQLQPLNRKVNWVNSLSVYYSWLTITFSLYMTVFNSVMTWLLLINYLDKQLLELAPSEWLLFAEFMLFMVISEFSTCFYGTILVITCFDQVNLVSKLRKMLALTIKLNNLQFHGRRGKTRDNNQMDRQILLILMHYRIFVCQLQKLRHTLGVIAAAAVAVLFLMPLLGRLHVPYFQTDDSMQGLRLLVVTVSCLVLGPADLCLVPVCYLNKRCLDLYCDLNSLLAHVTQISQNAQSVSQNRDTIISILRKELSHHDQVARQLAIRWLGMSFTYEDLVRLHFYFGFIVLTIMGENMASQKEPTGTIFTDPLGFF